MPNNLVVPSPYVDEIDDREGRVAISSTPLEYYNTATRENPGGLDPTIPYPYEISHTKEGDIVILERDDTNKVIEKSSSRDLRLKIEKLEKQHVFENAEAFVFNSAINILYFDTDRMTVKISPDRVFSSSYKYWAICGVTPKNGANVYFTGITQDDGSGAVISNLVDTEVVTSQSGDQVGVTCTGKLIAPLTHSHNYIVQFFDKERILVEQIPFQAYSVRQMVFDVVPNKAIVDVRFNMKSNDTMVLRRGGNWTELNLRIELIYADGSARDVTSEWIVGGSVTGRVMVKGLENIDTANLTLDGEKGFPIELIYFASTTNIDNPHADPVTLSISHTYYVKIIENEASVISNVLPVVWLEGESIHKKYCMKLYTLAHSSVSKRGYFFDESYRIKDYVTQQGVSSSRGNFSVMNGTDADSLYFINDIPVTTNITDDNNVKIPTKDNAEGVVYYFKTNIVHGTNSITTSVPSTTKATIGQNNFKPIRYIKIQSTNAGGVEGTHMKFINPDPVSMTNQKFIESLITEFTRDSVVPTHIRIRNGKNASVLHINIPLELTEHNLIATGDGLPIIQYENSSNYYIDAGTPLIVEFLNRTVGPDGNMITSVLGADVFYVSK